MVKEALDLVSLDLMMDMMQIFLAHQIGKISKIQMYLLLPLDYLENLEWIRKIYLEINLGIMTDIAENIQKYSPNVCNCSF